MNVRRVTYLQKLLAKGFILVQKSTAKEVFLVKEFSLQVRRFCQSQRPTTEINIISGVIQKG